ncbi:MAG TPA: orotate phosphoribosyltransferase [Synergistetes bacterium]|nr:orotate phosphoribosyltransferase [Synergistota bacterium]
MNDPVEVETIRRMQESGAFLEGHFLLSSGMHSGSYLQCALFLRYPENAAWAGARLGERIAHLRPDVIISPSVGGLIIGHETARYLKVPFLFCERESGVMKLRRFPAPSGLSFLVVEDVVTTGRSTAEVRDAIIEVSEGDYLGAACVVDRSSGKNIIGPSLVSLMKSEFPVYSPDECPLCADGLPLEEPGSRRLSR